MNEKEFDLIKDNIFVEHHEELEDAVIEACRKQIPKNPKKLTYELLTKDGWEYECPSCGSAIGVNNNAIDYTQEDGYCPTCGQKIDWSKRE